MERNFLIMTSLLILMICTVCFSAELSKDAQIRQIRADYILVEDSIRKIKPVSVTLNEFDNYLCYKADKKILKIELFSEGVRTSFYYKNRKVFFIFIENAWNKSVQDSGQPFKEERVYIYNDKIIEALIKETNGEDFVNVENKTNEKILSSKLKYEKELLNGYFGAYVALQTCEAVLK
ncbi:MAG: hypothetical protein JW982_06050 [Spirochaetes bacterium]|nr:hypothetical protein [Spirochaetota bacterium]